MIAIPSTTRRAVREEFAEFFTRARAQRRRTIRAFAEQEIRVVGGPRPGRYKCDTQPYARLLFDAIDTRRYKRHVITGPSQSGKSLNAFVIPTLYHLFEVGETVICGLPDLDMAQDKWREDILPVIEATRYRDLLPRTGSGSKGGLVTAMKFGNGATLRFMGGGGGDKARAAFTARVLVVTETDGLDSAGGKSREADKIKQLEARTAAFGDRAVHYLECTVSTEEGRTWQEYQKGTASRIALPCPHCRRFVYLEREDFIGWDEAADVIAAGANAAFACNRCGELWTDADRTGANAAAKLVHDGQSIDDDTGEIIGDAKPTDTLGFRWSAVNNLFASSAELGRGEWKARREKDRANADKARRQFTWALPWLSTVETLISLDRQALPHRMLDYGRGIVPPGVSNLTVFADINSRHVHWQATAWLDNARPHVVDYGAIKVPREGLSLDEQLLAAIETLADRCEAGFTRHGQTTPLVPVQVWIDSGWKSDVVYAAVMRLEARRGNRNHLVARYRPTKGYGTGKFRAERYRPPRKQSGIVLAIGEGYHFTAMPEPAGLVLVHIDANHWKSYWHTRLQTPLDNLTGAPQTLFRDVPQTHDEWAAHQVAEEPQQEFDAERGYIQTWKRVERDNHWLDAAAGSSAAGHFAGARLPIAELPAEPVAAPPPSRSPLINHQGQPFSVLNRR